MIRTKNYFAYFDCPVGRLLLTGSDDALLSIKFPQENQPRVPGDNCFHNEDVFAEVTKQLGEYFAGSRTEFTLAFELNGTDFQNKVWQVLLTIPFGSTLSYGDVAKLLGQPTASRAVGAANNANPIPIIVPCHRVIGADNTMVGFGGGVETKIRLLELEYSLSASSKEQGDLFY